MIKGSKVFLTAALAVLILGLAGCASQKEPAGQALAAIDKKFEESGAEIQKYMPDSYADVSKSIESMHEALSKEDYGDVVAEAGKVDDALKKAIAESRIRRAQIRIEMESEWTELTKTMPSMIAAMDRKIASQHGRPPQGMSRDAWKATIDSYDAAREAWSKAGAEMTNQNFEATVLAARDAKAKISGMMESLGVKAS